MRRHTPRSPFATASALLAASLGLVVSGCASAPRPVAEVAPLPPPIRVQLDGLRFLHFAITRADALSQMRGHGFGCYDEAATQTHIACTRTGYFDGNVEVVLSFAGGVLDAVRSPTTVPREDAMARFDKLVAHGRSEYPLAFVQRTDVVAIARFLPGDGSSIELRHFQGGGAIERIHFAPARPRPGATAILLPSR